MLRLLRILPLEEEEEEEKEEEEAEEEKEEEEEDDDDDDDAEAVSTSHCSVAAAPPAAPPTAPSSTEMVPVTVHSIGPRIWGDANAASAAKAASTTGANSCIVQDALAAVMLEYATAMPLGAQYVAFDPSVSITATQSRDRGRPAADRPAPGVGGAGAMGSAEPDS